MSAPRRCSDGAACGLATPCGARRRSARQRRRKRRKRICLRRRLSPQRPPFRRDALPRHESGLGGGVILEGKLFRARTASPERLGTSSCRVKASCTAASNRPSASAPCWTATRGSRPALMLASLLADVTDGDSPAVAIAEDWARSLAFGLSQTCRIVDADRIVLGGSLAALYRPMERRVMDAMRGFQDVSFPLPEILVEPDGGTGRVWGRLPHAPALSVASESTSERRGGGIMRARLSMFPVPSPESRRP